MKCFGIASKRAFSKGNSFGYFKQAKQDEVSFYSTIINCQ